MKAIVYNYRFTILNVMAVCTFFSAGILHGQGVTGSPSNGEDVITQMHEKYDGKWYKNLTFIQKTTFYNSDGTVRNVLDWYEALQIPTGLAIKFNSRDSGYGMLFSEGNQYNFQNGKLANTQKRAHELLLLGFMVYGQPPGQTISELTSNDFNLEKMYLTTYRGREVYVIGATDGEDPSNHFYIDKERLVFVKLVKYEANNTLLETKFEDYKQLSGGWIAPTVRFYMNGNQTLLEEYREISTPKELPEALFNPETFLQTPIPIN